MFIRVLLKVLIFPEIFFDTFNANYDYLDNFREINYMKKIFELFPDDDSTDKDEENESIDENMPGT